MRFVKLLPTLAEVAFCVDLLAPAAPLGDWRKQRKWLLIGWLLFMLTPFVVFMYPLRHAVVEAARVA